MEATPRVTGGWILPPGVRRGKNCGLPVARHCRNGVWPPDAVESVSGPAGMAAGPLSSTTASPCQTELRLRGERDAGAGQVLVQDFLRDRGCGATAPLSAFDDP